MPLGSVSGFGVASSSWWRWLVWVCLLGFCPWILSAQEQNRLQLAERYMQNGEADKALSLYEELYREDPQTFVYQGYLQCLQSLERYPEAEKLIRRQMKAAPQPLLLQIDLLQNFLLAGETKKARSNFEDFLSGLDIYGGSAVSLPTTTSLHPMGTSAPLSAAWARTGVCAQGARVNVFSAGACPAENGFEFL